MTRKSLLIFLKRQIWLALLLLAILATGGVLWGQKMLNTTPRTPPVASFAPSGATPAAAKSPSPSAALTSPVPSPTTSPAKTPTPSPSPTAAVDPNALTAEERALNEAAKQKIAGTGASSIDALVEMRVAIAEGVPALSLTITQGAVLIDVQTGSQIQELSGAYSLQPRGEEGVQLDGQSLPFIVGIEPLPGGSFTLGNRTYRGRLVIVNDSGKLWAVNMVNLRQYLYSVVASEVSPDWDADALKAQAIAARSYALTYHFKPISSLFDLGATEYYQVYSGIAREANTTNKAVDATASEYVSYKGKVVESLYAASEDIVTEAFQGQGMSQLGALKLADEGFTYQQILGKYYPGTKVGRFQQDY
jgi:stage II sporulation protein D